MKGVYWRPKSVSMGALLLVLFLALVGMATVELVPTRMKQDFYNVKFKAAHTMKLAMEELKSLRSDIGIPLDKVNDPTESGLIGWQMSELTSNSGHLPAKQTTINPNFAAVVVHLLKKANVEKDDLVAVGVSGSFPAINLATICAIEAIGAEPIIISSASSSEWGANIPEFTWLEMEAHLKKKGIIHHSSVAASVGGVEDKGRGMPTVGVNMLKGLIKSMGLPFIWPGKEMIDSIEQRMVIYQERAGDKPIMAYVNVGGGTVSVGTKVGKRMFKSGLNKRLPMGAGDLDSVMVRFAKDGIPVIHMSGMNKLAERYGLPLSPTVMAPVGEGKIFYKTEYNLWLTAGVLIIVLLALWGLVRMNLAYRLFSRSSTKKSDLPEASI